MGSAVLRVEAGMLGLALLENVLAGLYRLFVGSADVEARMLNVYLYG